MKPLEGMLVLDITQFMSGPLCSMILSDLGAEVIKLERPPVGDTSRFSPPGKLGASSYFISLNRGKKSSLLNLGDPRQKTAFIEMVKKADVLLENMRPGAMEKLGVGYDVLKKVNPRLVYTSISGYGQTGPLRARGAYDLVIQAESGMMSITGEKGGEPLKTGTSSSDLAAGLYAAIGTLAALTRAGKTGEGDFVDVAMLDATLATMENAVSRYLLTGIVPKPLGNRHSSAAPFQPFNTKTGKVLICSISDEDWQRLAHAVGRKDLAEEPRFQTMSLRQENVEALGGALQQEFDNWTAEDLIAALEGAKIVNGQINTLQQVVSSPQVQARNMIMSVAYPGAEPMQTAASPIKMASFPDEIQSYCPALGENTLDVMMKYGGLTKEEAEEIFAQDFPAVEEVIRQRGIR
jgi:CoA:oxalate CoA-transferase